MRGEWLAFTLPLCNFCPCFLVGIDDGSSPRGPSWYAEMQVGWRGWEGSVPPAQEGQEIRGAWHVTFVTMHAQDIRAISHLLQLASPFHQSPANTGCKALFLQDFRRISALFTPNFRRISAAFAQYFRGAEILDFCRCGNMIQKRKET
jgi:hypothetical protein